MPEPAGDRDDVHASGDQLRGMGVPKGMKGDLRHRERRQAPAPVLREAAWRAQGVADRFAGPREDERVVTPAAQAERQPPLEVLGVRGTVGGSSASPA